MDDLSEPEIVLNLNLKLNLWSKWKWKKSPFILCEKLCILNQIILYFVYPHFGFDRRGILHSLLLFYVLRRMFYVIWIEPINRFCVFCDSRVLCWVRFNFLSSRFWSKLEGNTLPSFWCSSFDSVVNRKSISFPLLLHMMGNGEWMIFSVSKPIQHKMRMFNCCQLSFVRVAQKW